MPTHPRPISVLAALILALLPVAGDLAGAAEREPPQLYDPLHGMDPSGRIPKVPLPESLPEPSRWRYIPEARIMPGNVFQRLLVSSFVTPQVFFQQDVGLGGGLALTDIDFRNQRRREFLGAFLTYTTEGQQRYRLVWRRWLHHQELLAGGVALEERSYVDAAGGYEKTLTRRFFGLGPETRPGAESSYTDEVEDAGFRVSVALPRAASDWVASLGVRGEHHNLSPGRVSGLNTTDQAFPDLFKAADGYSGLTVSAGLRYDSRDAQGQPYRGLRLGVAVESLVWQDSGDPAAVVSTFGSWVVPVPPLFHDGGDAQEENPPTDTLAVAAHVETTVGTLPYFLRPSLGGSYTLRGYIANRFTDDAAWHAGAEYRFWVIPRGFRLTRTVRVERVGLALFAEAGTVADGLGDLPSARIHTSYGVGVRVSLERTALFRADLGFSGEGLNFVLAFGLSF